MNLIPHPITPNKPPVKVGRNQAVFDKCISLIDNRIDLDEEVKFEKSRKEIINSLRKKRDGDMVTMYQAGYTTGNIADRFNLSSQQTRTILRSRGLALADRRKREYAK